MTVSELLPILNTGLPFIKLINIADGELYFSDRIAHEPNVLSATVVEVDILRKQILFKTTQ